MALGTKEVIKLEKHSCISVDDAEILRKQLLDKISKKEKIILDFKDVEILIGIFTREAFGELTQFYKIENIKEYIIFENIKEDDMLCINIALEYSYKYYTDDEYRKMVDEISVKNIDYDE